MPFPNQVYVQPAIAVAGDFCDANPRATLQAGAGGLVAGPAGVTVGRFAWVNNTQIDTEGAPASVSNNGTGVPSGFVHREQQGLITQYLQEYSMLVPAGFPVTLFISGGFFVRNAGATTATPGMFAFANYADGSVVFGAGTQTAADAGSGTLNAATVTGSIGPQTVTFNGSITGAVLTVTGTVSGGSIVVGGTLSGGTGVATGTSIVSQLTGTVGGVGTYAVSIAEQSVASALLTESYGLLTAATVTGTIGVGDTLTGTASGMVPAIITALGTGSGGAGTYILNATQTIALNSTITAATNVQTKYIAVSTGATGELVKITSWIYG